MKKLILIAALFCSSVSSAYYLPAGVDNISGNTTASSIYKFYYGTTSGGGFTFTLPLAAAYNGLEVNLYNITFGGSNNISVSRSGSDTINGATSDSITPGDFRRYVSNGTAWYVH